MTPVSTHAKTSAKTSSPDKFASPQSFGSLAILAEGRRLHKISPKLKKDVRRALIVNYAVFLVATLVLNGLLHYMVLAPFSEWAFGGGEGFWASAGRGIVVFAQILIGAVCAMASLIFSVQTLSGWHEDLAETVIRSSRDLPDLRFDIKLWFKTIWVGVFQGLRSAILALTLLLLGFIPLVGPVLVMVGEAWLIGQTLKWAYLNPLQGLKLENPALTKQLKYSAVKFGWLATALTLVPIAGWIVLPWLLTLQVIGLSSKLEALQGNTCKLG